MRLRGGGKCGELGGTRDFGVVGGKRGAGGGRRRVVQGVVRVKFLAKRMASRA